MNPSTHAFIWTDAAGLGRNRYALFRRVFDFADAGDCMLHLFADTRYRLIVNGKTIGHGPARFFVSHPEFDSYDLTPHLRHGKNVIAIVVNSCNAISFHSDVSTGGLCVWGVVQSNDGHWRAIDSPGHHADTHYLSFALNPAEYLDEIAMPANWDSIEFDDSGWKPAVIRRYTNWGELRPRSIPMLDESVVQPTKQLGAWLATPVAGEKIYSLFVTTTGGKSLHTKARIAIRVHLHSPRDQQITLASWWGKHWLNGQELKGKNRDDMGMRQEFVCNLHEGLNTLIVFEKLNYDYFDFTIGLQESTGIKPEFFVGGPWEEDLAITADEKNWPDLELPKELGAWKSYPTNERSPFPMKQHGWRTFTRTSTPVAAEATTPALALLFEFPGEVIGRPLLNFTAKANTIIDLFYTERLKPDGTADVHSQPWGIHMADRFITKSGRQQIHTFHPRGFKYLEILVTGDMSSFILHDLTVTRANYPVEFVGQFECSDPMLQKIWAMGRDTQHACMEDAYIDCPWRERGLYAGDMLVQFPVTLACFGDHALMRRCIELFFQSQNETGLIAGGAFGLPAGRHPDYSAIVLIALHDYWVRTGDVKTVIQLMPRIKRLATGLAGLKSSDPILLDGSDQLPYIDNCHMDKGGINCALNCFYQRSFHCAAKLFELAGDQPLSAEYSNRASQLAAAIREKFWNESRGVFTDRLPADKPDTEPSVPASTLPLLWDIASPAQAKRVLPWLMDAMQNNFRVPIPAKSEDLNVNAYFSFYCIGVLYKYGKTVEAEAFMRREWGRMIDAGAWTCWEYFIDNHSRCHAWSAAPTHYLSTQVLGITFHEPGNIYKIKIEPNPGTLTWARGVYPHPAGPIHISWQLQNDKLRVQHQAPPGIVVEMSEALR